jgi:hypothetical protein
MQHSATLGMFQAKPSLIANHLTRFLMIYDLRESV